MAQSNTQIIIGDALDRLRSLPDASVQACITSPPYFGLRDYGVEGQLGLEETPELYVERMVAVFREVHRVLRADGTFWLNIGDSYAGSWGNYGGHNRGAGKQRAIVGGSRIPNEAWNDRTKFLPPAARGFPGIKPKDLIGIPWMLAFALRADGWYLRDEIIWHKPNPMPTSQRDRCTRAHEQVFMFAKSKRYFYDIDALRTPLKESSLARLAQDVESQAGSTRANGGAKTNGTMKAVRFGGTKGGGDFESSASRVRSGNEWNGEKGATRRSVWTIPTRPFREAHFAVMALDLAVDCVKASTREGDTVLDPFGGAGTTGVAAESLGRNAVLIELNPEYARIAQSRLGMECVA